MQDTSVFFTPSLVNRVLMKLTLCTGAHCHDETGLGLLVPEKGNSNATSYRDILDHCVPPCFGEEPCMGVKIRRPHTFGHTVNIYPVVRF